MHFFDIPPSKSGPILGCFAHFGLDMCFAKQRHELYPHHNFQNCCGDEVLCTFWLGYVLRATTACNLSSLISPHGSPPAYSTTLRSHKPVHETLRIPASLPVHTPASSFFWLFLFSELLSPLLSSLTLPTSAIFICPKCDFYTSFDNVYLCIYVIYNHIYIYIHNHIYIEIYDYILVCVYIYIRSGFVTISTMDNHDSFRISLTQQDFPRAFTISQGPRRLQRSSPAPTNGAHGAHTLWFQRGKLGNPLESLGLSIGKSPNYS